MRFKAVAFDVDGTLYPESALDLPAARLVLRHPLLFAAFARSRRKLRRLALWEGYRNAPPADGEAFRRLQARVVAGYLGPFAPGGPERTGELLDEFAYRAIVELFGRVRPYPGLEAALDRVAAAGLRLAVLSDLPPGRKLELMGLAGRFEAALCSEDSGFLKPEPAPFLMLERALGLGPSDILYVGNSRKCDLAGAKAAGMAVAMVSPSPIEGADLSFLDWRDLADFAIA